MGVGQCFQILQWEDNSQAAPSQGTPVPSLGPAALAVKAKGFCSSMVSVSWW